jgi:hypothetical protein
VWFTGHLGSTSWFQSGFAGNACRGNVEPFCVMVAEAPVAVGSTFKNILIFGWLGKT